MNDYIMRVGCKRMFQTTSITGRLSPPSQSVIILNCNAMPLATREVLRTSRLY